MPIFAGPTLLPTKQRSPNFTRRTVILCFGFRTAASVSQGLAVIGLLQNADAKGLDPEDYDGSRWQGRLLKLGQKPSEQDLVSFDTALTVSAMRYIRAIHCGRANPKEFKFQLDMGGDQLPLAEFIQTQVVNAGDPAAEIQKLEPPFLGYRKLLALLPVYEGYAKQDDGQKLPTVTKTVRPGQPYAGVVRLGRFLQIIGDIPAGAQLNPNATIYEGALVEGVKHYQDRHGETPTGNLDARTINELNTPPAGPHSPDQVDARTVALASAFLLTTARGCESSRVSSYAR